MRLGKTHRTTVVWAAAAVLSFAGSAATAQSAFAKSDNGHNGKGGNNGTIKIHDGSEKNPKSNNPHLSCPIIVSFQGFDDATDNYTVDVHTIPPSSPHNAPIQLVTDSGSFVHHGDFPYTIDQSQLAGAKSNKGEYHVYVHVTATTSNGAIVKNKAVWLTPCEATTPPATGSDTLAASTSCDGTTLDYTLDGESTKASPAASGDWTFTPTGQSAPTDSGTFAAGSPVVLSIHDSGTVDATYGDAANEVSGDTADCASTPTPTVQPTTTSKPPTKPSTKPSVKVLGEHFTKGSKLPFTGPATPLVPLGLGALGLVFGGLALSSASRRRAVTID